MHDLRHTGNGTDGAQFTARREWAESPTSYPSIHAVTSNVRSPCLSVIMPVYNEKQTLSRIIETVLKQPLVAELICVDDCSLDGTVVVLERFIEFSPRVRIGAQLGRQSTAAPVGGPVLRATTGPFQNSRFELCCIRPNFAPLMTGHQSRQTTCQKTLSPALNIRGTTLQHAGYRTHSKARGERENHSGAPGILGSNRSGSDAPAQFSAFRRTNHNFLVLHSLVMRHIVSQITVTLP
jgi:glycosyltransferase involved in cell wall biosynthesis